MSPDDGNCTTPKKLRTAPLTPKSISRLKAQKPTPELPSHLTRLLRIQNAIQQALSHALATCAISPSTDSGRVLNVLNHISLKTYAGLSTSFELEDLKSLCWLWEWDGETLTKAAKKTEPGLSDEDNPFLEPTPSTSEWTRGSQGFLLSLGSYYSKAERKRIPAYGVGIEVEIDIDKDMGGGMAAVARWTATGEVRRKDFLRKLERWAELHADSDHVPPVPVADLPPLPATTKHSALTRTLASQSPKSGAAAQKFPIIPSSPSRSPNKKASKDVALPFPMLPSRSTSPTKVGRLLFPQTPSRRLAFGSSADLFNPQTPSSSVASPSTSASVPSTPSRHEEDEEGSIPQTPTTSRRQALYERIRARSLSKSPTKTPRLDRYEGSMTPSSMMRLTQEALRRRCILARLPEVAESVWMVFSSTGCGVSATPSSRRRRTMPMSEVAAAIIKSSTVPLSVAEANESLEMLVRLCPFFLKKIVISGQDWLEMPANSNGSGRSIGLGLLSTPSKRDPIHASPSKKSATDSAQELLTRSPRSVKAQGGGLREVREIIRKELELQE